jgi:hypothetical protein
VWRIPPLPLDLLVVAGDVEDLPVAVYRYYPEGHDLEALLDAAAISLFEPLLVTWSPQR